MKKFLALILCLCLLGGLVSAAFTDDASIGESYLTAVTALSDAGIIKGFDDGSFRPAASLTRAQGAKILYVIKNNSETAPAVTEAPFSDVATGHWAAGFVAWCAKENIIAGVGNNKFRPNGTLTGAAFAKMLLVAVGEDASKLVGASWVSATQEAVKALKLDTNANLEDTTLTREQACQTAYNFLNYLKEKEATASAGMKEDTVSFATVKDVKLLGRAEFTEEGVRTNFQGDGVEFTLECTGNLTGHFTSDAVTTYRAEVDGVLASEMQYTIRGSDILLWENLPAGKHTIRIIHDAHTSSSGYTGTIKGITATMKKDTLKAAAPKELYVEFVGDSVTAGQGVLGYPDGPWDMWTHCGTHGLGYKTAKLLDADYAIIAKGGTGAIVRTDNSGPYVSSEIYKYQNVWRDQTILAKHAKADVVVIGVGANDPVSNPDTEFETALKALLLQVRETQPTAKIVMFWNYYNDRHSSYYEKLHKELGGESKGYYCVKLQKLKNGSKNHPNSADNDINAATLADFIKGIL